MKTWMDKAMTSLYNCPCNVRHGSKVKLPWQEGETVPTILQMAKSRKEEKS